MGLLDGFLLQKWPGIRLAVPSICANERVSALWLSPEVDAQVGASRQSRNLLSGSGVMWGMSA